MRDDRLGGRDQLEPVLDYLGKRNLFAEALAEKAEAVNLWDEIKSLADEINWPENSAGEFVKVSVEYGRLLFTIVEQGWRILIAGQRADRANRLDAPELETALARYNAVWAEFRLLATAPQCASLYEGRYFNLPGTAEVAGMDESAKCCKKLLTTMVLQ